MTYRRLLLVSQCCNRLQVFMHVLLHPLAADELRLVDGAADVPEPMFPGNGGGEASSCLLNEKLRCVHNANL
jgi:hypothetical protein